MNAELAVSGSNVSGDVPFSCALRLPSGVVEARAEGGARGDLAALVAGLCDRHGVRPEALGALRIDVGPGSYTGLRVAVTFVRFLHRFAGVPVFATDSLSLLATAACGRAARGCRLRPLLDARRGRFHVAELRNDEVLQLLAAPAALPLASISTSFAAGDVIVCPAAVETLVADAVRAAGAGIVIAAGVAARDLFRPELSLLPASVEALEPRYLMGSYAEE